jgi:hypothetical protein
MSMPQMHSGDDNEMLATDNIEKRFFKGMNM